jgi:peptidoglycan/xylan/chitin deacetylase (PgdA/CDA1 family)
MRAVRSFFKSLTVSVFYRCGLFRFVKSQLRQRNAIVVVMFHRVLTGEEQSRTNCLQGIVVTARTFDRIARYLAETFEVVDLKLGAPGWTGSERLRVAVTFDDGWVDNATTAAPTAEQYHVPMTIFVCPGLIGRSNPFWPEYVIGLLRTFGANNLAPHIARSRIGRIWQELAGAAGDHIENVVERLKRLPGDERDASIAELAGLAEQDGTENTVDRTMGWDVVSRLHQTGVTFGLHTQTHQILTTIPMPVVRDELRSSKQCLESQLGHDCGLFAYPNGSWSPEIRAETAAAGYKLAFTTEPAPWTEDSDPLLIPRVNVWEGTAVDVSGRFSPAMLEYNLFWKTWRAMRSNSN